MKLSLRARRILHTLPIEVLLPQWGDLSGHETLSVLGDEADFNEYKAYALGDEVRRIDWKVYARRERFYVKRYSSERARSTLILLDVSASMEEAFSNNRDDRRGNQESNTFYGLKGVLGYLFHYLYLKQEPYALALVREGKIDFHKVGTGSQQLQIMLEVIKKIQTQGTNGYTEEILSALQYDREIKNILFFSDFQLEPQVLTPLMQMMHRRQLAITCITYFNSKLLDIQFLNGLRWIKDRETGGFAVMNEQDMKRYRKIIMEHYEWLERVLLTRGGNYRQIDFKDHDELTNFTSLFKR